MANAARFVTGQVRHDPVTSTLRTATIFVRDARVGAPRRARVTIVGCFFGFRADTPEFGSFLVPRRVPDTGGRFRENVGVFYRVGFGV